MPSQTLCVRVPDSLLQKFHSHINQHGLTITKGLLSATAAYVGDHERLPLVVRVSRG